MAKLKITDLGLDGVKIIEPKVFNDNRGCSFESYSIKDFEEIGIKYNFVLDYQAVNMKKNTLRGIHFQNNPHPQTKLVRVLNGKILDYVVDLRKNSPTFKKWVCHTLSSDNYKQILIPNGFGHAFMTLEDNTSVQYKFDDYYDGNLVRTINWNDPDIGIKWESCDMIMSQGDMNAVYLKDSDVNFSVEENN